MTDDRYNALQRTDEMDLTAEEIAEGWHWCAEFDGLLIGPDMPEAEVCQCDAMRKRHAS